MLSREKSGMAPRDFMKKCDTFWKDNVCVSDSSDKICLAFMAP